MPKRNKVTPSSLPKVLSKLKTFLENDDEAAVTFCEEFDDFLDELVNGDFFGTEAQCDPRGDQRD